MTKNFEIPKSLIHHVDPDALIIPPRPFRVVIDCSSAGNWRSPDGQTIYAAPRKESDRIFGIMPLRLSETFTEWDQECADLLFIPISGDAVGKGEELGKLPYGLLCVTRLKRNNSLTGSLDAFETWISRICSTTGRHPATWIWWSHFERKTGNIPDDKTGELKPATWHRFHWHLDEIHNERQYKMLVQVGERVQRDPELKTLPNTTPKVTEQTVLAPDESTPDLPQLPEATEPEVAEWYLPNSEKPLTLSQLEELINSETLVWGPGLSEWTVAQDVPQLAALFEEF
jgi:hypothetical protein